MKRISFLLFILLSALSLSAQTETSPPPPYKNDPNIPAFIIQQPDSSWFSAEQLPKYEYTAIVYFSPSCGHCQITARDLVKNMDSLKNVFFVFVSYNPLNEIKEFYNYYGLNVFPNVRIGRDPKYFIPAFFRVEATPFVAVYDANRKLVQVFDPPNKNAMEAADLIALIHKK
jgi:cytochrome oxidase Cu insertion factor (SCO1/SenC/PrrC family)